MNNYEEPFNSSEMRKRYTNIDNDFYELISYIKASTEEQLLDQALRNLVEVFSSMDIDKKTWILSNWNKDSHLWGPFDPQNRVYDHLSNGIHELKQNYDRFVALYEKLADYRSRLVLYSIMHFWISLDANVLDKACEHNFSEYYDHDLLRYFTTDEVVVDCGAYDGDSAVSYLENFGKCKKMYLYDMVPSNLKKARQNLCNHENIIYRNAGVTCKENEGRCVEVTDFSSPMYSLLFENIDIIKQDDDLDHVQVPLVSLDKDVSEKISFIKMDIEGAELEALQGAENHIRNDHPTLAICTYHHYDHMWKIPEQILKYNANYRLYMRFNGDANSYIAHDYFLLAVPFNESDS